MERRNLIAALIAVPLMLTTAMLPAQMAKKPRVVQTFNDGWRFLQADAKGAEQPDFNDAAWTAVALPHDWAIAGPFKEDASSTGAGAFAPTGVGWYRKTFQATAADATPNAARRMFIVFDGVMANSDVYLNGELLGHRPYGYVSFTYELTPHLRAGVNTIAVRVDDADQPASRWYPGAGINRQVRLVTVGDTHIVPWGTFAFVPVFTSAGATVKIQTTIVNEAAAAANVTLRVSVTSPNGTTLAEAKNVSSSMPVSISPGSTTEMTADVIVPKPDRWDLSHPVLYTAHAEVLRDGKVVDNEDVPFGIRDFHFDPNKGFFLNGVHHKVYGVALHTDAGAVGTAVPLAVWERRLTQLRKLGVNAIRTAHNPPAPEFLDLADRMGFLVMDEMFDCWTVAKNKYDYHLYFKDWSIRDLTDTVMRDRNHPSIILWSAGNEIHDTPNPQVAIPILAGLVKNFHLNDPTRPVTQALFRPNASHDYDDGLADLLDVVGQNYREQEILAAHAQKPTRSIIGTENTHDRNQWVAMRDHAEYSGQFLWAGIDYLGESRSWPTIGSGSGLLNAVAMPHGRAYERQSWWTTTPMVAMVRRVAIARAAAVDPGYANATSIDQSATPAPRAAGQRAAAAAPDPSVRFSEPLLADWTPKDMTAHSETVEVYTNAEEVELFLNGKSLGVEKLHADASAITYKVPFETGTLKAVAKSGGKIVATQELKTAGKAAGIRLAADAPGGTVTPDWNDARSVIATLVDANGTVIPDSSTMIHFAVSGPGRIVAVDNGNFRDLDPYQATERKLYLGNAIALVRATADAGSISVTATADGLPTATAKLTAVPVAKEDANVAASVAAPHTF